MATSTTKTTKTARANKMTADQLATAKTADGAIQQASVYDIVGIRRNPYGSKTFAEFQEKIRKMNTIELHDFCYQLGVLASHKDAVTIDRLEESFLQNSPYGNTRKAADDGKLSTKQQAERFLSGRR